MFAVTDVFQAVATVVAVVAFYWQYKERQKAVSKFRRFNPNLSVLDNYDQVKTKLIGLMDNEAKQNKPIAIKNIGLDLERIIPDL